MKHSGSTEVRNGSTASVLSAFRGVRNVVRRPLCNKGRTTYFVPLIRTSFQEKDGSTPYLSDSGSRDKKHAMTLFEVLHQMRTSKVRIVPRRLGLAFQYPRVLDPETLADFRRYEVDIVDVYNERAAIREYDGGLDRDDAERAAVGDLMAMGRFTGHDIKTTPRGDVTVVSGAGMRG